MTAVPTDLDRIFCLNVLPRFHRVCPTKGHGRDGARSQMIFNKQGVNQYTGVRCENRLQNQNRVEFRETQLNVKVLRGFPGTQIPKSTDLAAGASSDKNVFRAAE